MYPHGLLLGDEMRAGICGSVSDSTKVAIAVDSVSITTTEEPASAVSTNMGATLSANPRAGNFLTNISLVIAVSGGTSGDERGTFSIADIALTHPQFGLMGGGFIGEFDGFGQSTDSESVASLTTGSTKTVTGFANFLCAVADTGNIGVTANTMIVRCANTGQVATGPSDNESITITVV